MTGVQTCALPIWNCARGPERLHALRFAASKTAGDVQPRTLCPMRKECGILRCKCNCKNKTKSTPALIALDVPCVFATHLAWRPANRIFNQRVLHPPVFFPVAAEEPLPPDSPRKQHPQTFRFDLTTPNLHHVLELDRRYFIGRCLSLGVRKEKQ